MTPARNHKYQKFNTENLMPEDLKTLIKLPYVEAMDMLFSITGIENSKSKYFTQRKIELWTVMPYDWRMQETTCLIEMEDKLNSLIN